MPTVNNLTHDEIVVLLEFFYPTMIWKLSGTDYDDLIVLPESPIPKPSLDELKSHATEARQELARRKAYEQKVRLFFTRYPVDKCVVNILAAILKPANSTFALLKQDADLVAMSNYWKSL